MANVVPISTIQSGIQQYQYQSTQILGRLAEKMQVAQAHLATLGIEGLEQSRGQALEKIKAWQVEEASKISHLETQIAKCAAILQEKFAFLQKAQDDVHRATNIELWELKRKLHAYIYCACYHKHTFIEPHGDRRTFRVETDPRGLIVKEDVQRLAGSFPSTPGRDGYHHAYVMGFSCTDQEGWRKIPGPHPETQGYKWNGRSWES